MVYWETWVLFKNSVDTGANLYKELKVLDVLSEVFGILRIWLGGEKGFLQGTYIYFQRG